MVCWGIAARTRRAKGSAGRASSTKNSHSSSRARTRASRHIPSGMSGRHTLRWIAGRRPWSITNKPSTFIASREPAGQAETLNRMGLLLEKDGQRQAALDLYSRARPMSQDAGYRAIEISIPANLARVQRDLGQLKEAGEDAQKAIALIDTGRAGHRANGRVQLSAPRSLSLPSRLVTGQHALPKMSRSHAAVGAPRARSGGCAPRPRQATPRPAGGSAGPGCPGRSGARVPACGGPAGG